MKKIWTMFIVLVLGLVLVSCGKKTAAFANTTALENEISDIEDLLEGVHVLNVEVINPLEQELGEKFITKSIKDQVDTELAAAKSLLMKVDVKQSEVDAKTAELESLRLLVTSGIVIGLKPEEVEISLEGLNEIIGIVEGLLVGVIIGESEETVARGQKFLPEQDYNDAHDLLDLAKDKRETELEQEELETLIQDLSDLRMSLVVNIKTGTQRDIYKVNLDNLDLGGKTLTFFTHVMSEDNPYLEGYDSQKVNQAEYVTFLNDLQTDYNFTLEYDTYDDYDDQVEEISIRLRSTADAAIMRISETKLFMDHIKAENIAPITDVINSLQEQFDDDYRVNDWQIEKGRVLDHNFGIQRFDGVTYPDLMMFNRTLLKDALGQDAEMPDELWENGEWTFDRFVEMVGDLDDYYRGTGIHTVGLTPYYLGINAVNANGIELVDTTKTTIEQQLQLNKTVVANVIAQYIDFLFGQNSNSIWYDAGKSDYDDAFLRSEPVNKNHLFDTFANGSIAIAAFQNWQADRLEDATFEASIVPYPQRNAQNNSIYISPIEAGDILAVTRGTNSNEVATILMLMNKFMKNVEETFYENQRVNLGMDEEATMDDVMAAVFVLQKTKNVQEADILRAREIAAFIHGYHKDYKHVTQSSFLAQVAGDDLYAMAIQRTLYEGGGANYNSYINQQIQRIKKSYEDVLKVVNQYN